MARRSKIEWTGISWNPVTGCNKVSDGCQHCYAERMAIRLQGMGLPKYVNGFKVTLHNEVLNKPERLNKPHVVFVNSMGDLFHPDVPTAFIQRVFEVMASCKHHIFQVLTKRSPRLRRIHRELTWANNIWMGVTVENGHYTYRINDIRETPAYIKWLSCEPLLGSLHDINLSGIDWVVVGGESGPGARPMRKEWVLEIQKQCGLYNAAFFFKQWGGVNKKKTGRLLRGKLYDEMPSCPQFESGQVSLF